MASYQTDPRVDDYIDRLPDWQQEICRQVRDIAHDADPEIFETIKRSVQPYFVSPRGPSGDQKPGKAVPPGNVCALLATKDHVNVFLYDGAIVPDPDGIITGGHDNQTARTVAVYEGESIPVAPLVEMFRQIIANNRAGGWRKLKATS